MSENFSPDLLASTATQRGPSLADLSRDYRLLVVFLRHGGCPFCREALAELFHKRAAIENAGARIVLVHMMTDEQAVQLFRKYGLDDVDRISDPQQELYRAFGLLRGSAGEVWGPRVWWRGLKAAFTSGQLPGKPIGDIYQMQGTFLIEDGELVRTWRAELSSQRPNYVEVVNSGSRAREF